LHPQIFLRFSVATMKRNVWFAAGGMLVIGLISIAHGAVTKEPRASKGQAAAGPQAPGANVEFFEAVEAGQIKARFIAMNDHEARLIVTNNTKQPVSLKLPEAFAGVPVAAQFGGAGARGGGGRVGGGRTGTTGGGQQTVGGGFGGGGGGLGGGGGGGGFFSVPPEKTAKINFPVLCLNHGLRDPSSSAPYKMVPADQIDRPAVVELLKAFGRGELKHAGAQAAAWHLNSDLSWNELAAKLTGTRRSFRRAPYFSADDINAGMAYATAATRLAEANAAEYQRAKKAPAEKENKPESSFERSTADTDAIEPAKSAPASTDEQQSTTGEENK
jgi:hypothetical protein